VNAESPHHAGTGSQKVIAATDPSIAPAYGRRARPHRPTPDWTPRRGTRLRRDAALRCEPLTDGRRDPCVPLTVIYARTLAYGLTPAQLEHERERLRALGWTSGEVAVALGEVTR
jgi:hypothetical protein